MLDCVIETRRAGGKCGTKEWRAEPPTWDVGHKTLRVQSCQSLYEYARRHSVRMQLVGCKKRKEETRIKKIRKREKNIQHQGFAGGHPPNY